MAAIVLTISAPLLQVLLQVWMRRVYLDVSSRLIRRYATMGLAVSTAARDSLFRNVDRVPMKVVHCSIDCSPFRGVFASRSIRRELGIPEDALVIGHVGHFRPEKNHEFLVRIAAEIVRLEPRAWFLLVGDGPLRASIEALFREALLSGRSTFTGVSADVPKLMRGALDALVLPSRFEGLPLVLVEAQAAGLSCVISSAITCEADVVGPLIHRIPLTESAAVWARSVVKVVRGGPGISQSCALDFVEASPFGSGRSVKALERIYAAEADPASNATYSANA